MRIAIVGTGIAGLSAARMLADRHDIEVFERAPRLGGHTNTVAVDQPGRAPLPVDTGFIVYNEVTYPLLVHLFDELGVETQASEMSWSLRCERCDLEYAGSPRGLLARPRTLTTPRELGMLSDILRFNRLGRRLVDDPRSRALSLGGFLRTAGFGHGFRAHYLLPMAAAIWSSGTEAIEHFPLHTLLRFFANHGLLGVTSHHRWRTVAGGAGSYIPRLTAGFADRLHVGTGVDTLIRDTGAVTLRLSDGTTESFDAAVVAVHADEALGMLADPTRDEKELLGAWDYPANDTFLHTDTALLPRREAVWASWNYRLDDCRTPTRRVSLNYHMNRLQRLDAEEQYVVSLNPSHPPAPGTQLRRMTYTHPGYTPESLATHDRLDELNGTRRTFYAGAYHRSGFHEDALWSAVRAVSHLGVRWPS